MMNDAAAKISAVQDAIALLRRPSSGFDHAARYRALDVVLEAAEAGMRKALERLNDADALLMNLRGAVDEVGLLGSCVQRVGEDDIVTIQFMLRRDQLERWDAAVRADRKAR
jgi:N-methylhydantoinase B/oxoprolinase/acetone carboxylase alpha subunit